MNEQFSFFDTAPENSPACPQIPLVFLALLDALVPRLIWDFKRRDGPTKAEQEHVAAKLDKIDEWSADAGQVAFAIAVMACRPGGVVIFGRHYDESLATEYEAYVRTQWMRERDEQQAAQRSCDALRASGNGREI